MQFRRVKLKNVTTKIGSGATPRGGEQAYTKAGTSLIRSQNIYDFEFKEEGLAFINDDQATRLANVELQSGDILLNITGDSIGRCCIVPAKYLPARVNQHVSIIRANEQVIPRFLLYYINAPKNKADLLNHVHGGTRRALTKGIIEDYEINLPPLPIQRRIAEILGRLDDKIEVNRRINRTLEQMAQALYQHWFVDFGPFQDGEFVESELGPIPKGWEVKPLADALEVNPSRPLGRGQIVPYLEMGNMPTASARALAWEHRGFNSGMRFKNGDVLVARITPCLENGKTAFVDFLEDNQVGWGSTEYIVLRSKPPLPLEYAYCLARSDDFRTFAIQRMTGTSGRQRVAADSLSFYPVIVPPAAIGERYGEKVRPMFAAMKRLDDESQKLAEIRDYLLPKLLSGAISVEAGVEQAAEATQQQLPGR